MPARTNIRYGARIVNSEDLLWVSLRKARDEHIFSAMPTVAAGSEPCRHLR
jgi:hypothetical protein